MPKRFTELAANLSVRMYAGKRLTIHFGRPEHCLHSEVDDGCEGSQGRYCTQEEARYNPLPITLPPSPCNWRRHHLCHSETITCVSNAPAKLRRACAAATPSPT